MPVPRITPPMTVAPTLSVVVPAWNEAASVAWTLRSLRDSLDVLVANGSLSAAELVLVDDASTDATAAIARQVSEEPGVPVLVVSTDGGRGLGGAVRRGLREASGELVYYTDADLPVDPGELGRLVRVLRTYEADLLCGYRFDRTSEGPRRSVQSAAYNLLVRVLLPVEVRDVNFACKLLRRQLLDEVLPALRSEGSFIDAELVARCVQADARVVQVGVDYFPRAASASTLGGWSAIAGILREARDQFPDLRRRR